MFVTARANVTNNPIPTAVVLPDPRRDQNITIRIRLELTDVNPLGVIFEFGGATTGMALVCNDGLLELHAGDAGDDGVTVAVAAAMPDLTVGRIYDIVTSVRPGTGEARLWVNGRMMGRATAVNGQLPNGWADANDSGIEVIEGTLTSRVMAPEDVDLEEARVAGNIEVYAGQIPRHFDDSVFA